MYFALRAKPMHELPLQDACRLQEKLYGWIHLFNTMRVSGVYPTCDYNDVEQYHLGGMNAMWAERGVIP